MVFAHDFCTLENTSHLRQLFEATMEEEGVLIDEEIPFERKLLIPLSFAEQSARAVVQCQWLIDYQRQGSACHQVQGISIF